MAKPHEISGAKLETIAFICDRLTEGATMKEIAYELGVSKQCAEMWMVRYRRRTGKNTIQLCCERAIGRAKRQGIFSSSGFAKNGGE